MAASPRAACGAGGRHDRPMIDQSDLDEDDEVEIGGGDERPGKETPR
jgi:hypothetical protein